MTVTAPNAVRLTPTGRALLEYLSMLFQIAKRDGGRFVCPSVAAMATAINRHPRTIKKAKGQLIAAGILSATARYTIVRPGLARRLSDRLFLGWTKPGAKAPAFPGIPAYAPPPRRPARWQDYLTKRTIPMPSRPQDGHPLDTACTHNKISTSNGLNQPMLTASADSLAAYYARLEAHKQRSS